MVLSKKRARHVIEEIIALFPDAKPSLDFRNHFELLVAVMLSAQTTDAAVNKATPGLFAAFPTPQAMAAASEADIAKHISKLGLSIEIRPNFSKNVPNNCWITLMGKCLRLVKS